MTRRAHPRPWHRGSVFGDGRRRPLDREQRARFRFLARAHARAGRLPAKQEWVALALLKRLGEDGQCDPSHDTLAADAGCSSRTVGRAMATMQVLGLVRWEQRMVRDGWRAEQTSNAYVLLTGPAAILPNFAVPACDGHSDRETRREEFKMTLPPPSPDAQAALAQRRAVIEARMLRNRPDRLTGIADRAAKHPGSVVSIKTRRPVSDLEAALAWLGAAIAAVERRNAQVD